ncbi:MAG: hypothetical protein NTW86_06735 [Candidatus Sumerlaeota bacterium]|nr:hypothetical protein [Candidatus Sumerlaeota bacterium]
MSFENGWAAIHLRMPKRIPRTEYSAPNHWELVKAVTGIDVGPHSPGAVKQRASAAFMTAWNFDLRWSTAISHREFGELRTSMGHAEYAAGGVDRNDYIHCPFKAPEEVIAFDPWTAYGEKDKKELTRRFEEAYRKNCEGFPDAVNMTGIYVTCVSGLISIFGWEMLLLGAGVDPEGFGAMTNRYASWIQQYFDALAEADVPVVMIHDDFVLASGPIFHPRWYRKYVFPNYKNFFAPLRESGKKILFTSDGKYTMFVDDLAECGIHGFVLEPMTDMRYIAEKYGKTHVFIGNADTRILLSGPKQAIRAEVERCIATGRDCPGFVLAVGNHIPANTPVENALYYNQVYEELSRRQ